jgi:hypothetical protein
LTKSRHRDPGSLCGLNGRTRTVGLMPGDLLAILVGILCFAILYALMEGIDRI